VKEEKHSKKIRMASISNSSYDASSEYSESSTQSLSFPDIFGNQQPENTPTSFAGLFSKIKPLFGNNKEKTLCGRDTPILNLKCPKKLLRPAPSFSQLIRDVLLEHDSLSANEICRILSKRYPDYFSMDSKNWQASVRNCLSKKTDFVKEGSQKCKYYWSLCPKVKAKLKPLGYYEFDPIKENTVAQESSAGKYVPIMPKPVTLNSCSQDSFTRIVDRQFTPLKMVSSSTINRQCQSEDKNLNRCRETVITLGLSRENSISEPPRKKLFKESESLLKKCTIKPDSIEFYSVSKQTNILEGDENAIFDGICSTASDQNSMSRDSFPKFLPLCPATNTISSGCLEIMTSDKVKAELTKENEELQEVFDELSQDSCMSPEDHRTPLNIDFTAFDELHDL